MIEKETRKSNEVFWFLFSAGVYALITAVLFLDFLTPSPRIKNNDFDFYLMGWIVFVPLGILIEGFLKKLNERALKIYFFNRVLTSFNFIFLLYLLYPGTWYSHQNGKEIFYSGFVIFLFLPLLALIAVKTIQRLSPKRINFIKKYYFLFMSFIFSLWLLRLTYYSFAFFKDFSLINIFVFVFIVSLIYLSLRDEAQKNKGEPGSNPDPLFFKGEFFFYFAAVIFIVMIVVNPNFYFDKEHYSFFLGPLADLKGGKAFLVNINSQYGVLIFYFLSCFFKFLPLGFKSLSFVLTLLFVVQYFCFCFITRQLFNSRLFSLICLAIVLMANYFATIGHMTEYPSVGPLRFGFFYFLMALIILRNRHPKHKKHFYFLESILVAAAVFWSFEVCVYTALPYLGLIFYEALIFDEKFKIDWRFLVKRLILLTLVLLAFLSFIYFDAYLRTGQIIHWSYYFDYILLCKNGYYMLLMPPIGGWWLLFGILFLSFFIVLGSLTKSKSTIFPAHFNSMVFLTFYGICQFIYYVGRAHSNNLFHVSVPSILLGAYWLYWIRKGEPMAIPTPIRKTAFVYSLAALGIYLQALIPPTVEKLTENFRLMPEFAQNCRAAAHDFPRDDHFAKTADLLMNKYSGTKKKIAYFFGDRGLEVSMYAGRINAFPYNDIGQASICPTTMKRIMSSDLPVVVGDCIYLSKDMEESFFNINEHQKVLSPIEKTLLARINQKFKLKFIEQQNDIKVYRVVGEKIPKV